MQKDELEQSVLQYRLTQRTLRNVIAVDRELGTAAQALQNGPSALEGRFLSAYIERMESTPAIALALARHELTARDYVLTVMMAGFTEMLNKLVDDGVMPQFPTQASEQNVALWRAFTPAFRDELSEWMKVHVNDPERESRRSRG